MHAIVTNLQTASIANLNLFRKLGRGSAYRFNYYKRKLTREVTRVRTEVNMIKLTFLHHIVIFFCAGIVHNSKVPLDNPIKMLLKNIGAKR